MKVLIASRLQSASNIYLKLDTQETVKDHLSHSCNKIFQSTNYVLGICSALADTNIDRERSVRSAEYSERKPMAGTSGDQAASPTLKCVRRLSGKCGPGKRQVDEGVCYKQNQIYAKGKSLTQNATAWSWLLPEYVMRVHRRNGSRSGVSNPGRGVRLRKC